MSIDFPTTDKSLGLTPGRPDLDLLQRVGLGLLGVGVAVLIAATLAAGLRGWASLLLILGLITAGSLVYSFRTYLREPAGIRNNRAVTASLTGRGALGWLAGVVLTAFYCIHYWKDAWFAGLHDVFDPISLAIVGKETDKYFFYALLYTVAVLIMGVRALLRYRHNRYQIVRTCMVMFSQFVFAFSIPFIMARIAGKEFWPSYFWPLGYTSLFPENAEDLIFNRGALGAFIFGWGVIMILVATPILTWFFGKRWYCSWVCGCGGLANTFGDGWRHLSDKSMRAWKIERVTIFSVLAFVIITTGALWPLNSRVKAAMAPFEAVGIEQVRSEDPDLPPGAGIKAVKALAESDPAGYGVAAESLLSRLKLHNRVSKTYAFLIGSIFAGVIGTGFYPILGTRVWCRFGCPMAAILGTMQRFFSRFRITTNGAQCISCGNCSKYCEMGIDVRWYAQRGQNIVRASCVGCGMCAAVCPRGVLSLENGPRDNRLPEPISLTLPEKSGIQAAVRTD